MTLSVRNLSFAYRKEPVLTNVEFTATPGRLLAILGPNGVGKTTLFRCILGEQKRYSGTIEVDGVNLAHLSPRALAHRIAYIPQTHAWNVAFSVRDMVLLGTSHTLSPLSVPGKKQELAAEAALRKLGIDALSEQPFSHLSGGEQQLVYIARALAQNARILIMDEPTAALDYGNRLRVLSEVRALAKEGDTVLLSTHDPQYALWYADEILALKNGRVEAFGETERVLTPALLETLYARRVTLTKTDAGCVILPATGERIQSTTGSDPGFHKEDHK